LPPALSATMPAAAAAVDASYMQNGARKEKAPNNIKASR
jgi:hypothetical protein